MPSERPHFHARTGHSRYHGDVGLELGTPERPGTPKPAATKVEAGFGKSVLLARGAHVVSLRALLPLHDLELHPLTFF